MKSQYFATIQNGKISSWTDAGKPVELEDNQVPLNEKEFVILQLFRGDIKAATQTVQNMSNRIQNWIGS